MQMQELQAELGTRDLGREAWIFAELPSTQTHARDLAFRGCAHGTLVLAEKQSDGRGRAGRLWRTGEGSLAFSVVLARHVVLAHAHEWSFVAGLALHDAFAPHAREPVQLKWPNDLLSAKKKFAGILCSLELGPIPAVVCGIGVNLGYDPGLPDRACAFEGAAASHATWLGRILRAFERRADAHLRSRASTLAAYRERMAFIGERIQILTQHGARSGILRAVNDAFELVLDDGSTIATADVWPG